MLLKKFAENRKVMITVLSLLAIALVFVMGTAVSRAAGTSTDWYIEDTNADGKGDTLHIGAAVPSGKTASAKGTFKVSGYAANYLVPWQQYKDGITKVVVEKTSVAPASTAYWFCNFAALKECDLSCLVTSSATDMRAMFFGCSSLKALDLSGFSTAKVTNMSQMFSGCSALSSLDLKSFSTAAAVDMRQMFRNCSALETLNISTFNTEKVTDMTGMFQGCEKLKTLDVSSFSTASCTDMGVMFAGCSSLTVLDVSSFRTGKVTDMAYMFMNCSALASLDLSSFDTSAVSDMSGMFDGCKALGTLNVSGFSTANVRFMYRMFADCAALAVLDIKTFSTASAEDMSGMFQGAASLRELHLGRDFEFKVLSDASGKAYYAGLNNGGTLDGQEHKGWMKGKPIVTSFMDENEPVTLNLYKGQSVSENDKPIKTITVTGNDPEYDFGKVDYGDYTLVVSKNNHLSHSYPMTVTENRSSSYTGDQITGKSSGGPNSVYGTWKWSGTFDSDVDCMIYEDAIIYPLGDVTGDGVVNAKDLSRLYFHVNGSKLINDEYVLSCGDVTGDGVSNAKDLSRIYFHVNMTRPLW